MLLSPVFFFFFSFSLALISFKFKNVIDNFHNWHQTSIESLLWTVTRKTTGDSLFYLIYTPSMKEEALDKRHF